MKGDILMSETILCKAICNTNSVDAWRLKHPKCIYCNHCRLKKKETMLNSSVYECLAKNLLYDDEEIRKTRKCDIFSCISYFDTLEKEIKKDDK